MRSLAHLRQSMKWPGDYLESSVASCPPFEDSRAAALSRPPTSSCKSLRNSSTDGKLSSSSEFVPIHPQSGGEYADGVGPFPEIPRRNPPTHVMEVPANQSTSLIFLCVIAHSFASRQPRATEHFTSHPLLTHDNPISAEATDWHSGQLAPYWNVRLNANGKEHTGAMLAATTRQLPLAASRVGLGRALPAAFAASARRGYALPAGPPPSNFRITKKPEETESTMDRAGNYFLMTEMLRGMYVLLEQFFRPPYVLVPSIPPAWGSRR